MGDHGRHEPGIGQGRARHHVASAGRRPEGSVLVLDRDEAGEHGGQGVAHEHLQVAGQLWLEALRDDAVAVVDLLDQEEAVAHLQPRDGGGARAHRHLDRPVGAGWHGQAPLLERHMPLESLKRVEHAQRGPGARLLACLPNREPRRLNHDGAAKREPAEPLVDAPLDGLAHGEGVGRGQLLRLDADADGGLAAELVAHGELEAEVGHGARVDGRARQQRRGHEHAQREHGQHAPAGRAVTQQQPPEDGHVPHARTRVAVSGPHALAYPPRLPLATVARTATGGLPVGATAPRRPSLRGALAGVFLSRALPGGAFEGHRRRLWSIKPSGAGLFPTDALDKLSLTAPHWACPIGRMFPVVLHLGGKLAGVFLSRALPGGAFEGHRRPRGASNRGVLAYFQQMPLTSSRLLRHTERAR